MKRILSKLLICVGCLLVLGAASLIVAVWRFDQPPFDMARLEHLVPGMTPEQVRHVIGEPSSNYDRSWAYSGWWSWSIVYVAFDESGQYLSHRYDF
ncbi:MAG: hypothetical protein ACI89X_000696 [Planctomycetota bacterium]|jgi:hypothetical protein